ncbi:DUF5134 domain-containing protein [Streptomyces sp. DT24]|uniref:DUF5134 domain-containing protein n=1 Tax=unclassified Streptomyces TaxID=2593676 RepID=UPI0023B95F6A|nr:DUF5134 domain-containing protein [Streptomyces sp. AM 4-1-1]WEH32162.1 DUF5134 domain-containing protein [Streptomyces sp. AM 4-1-1]
MHGSAMSGWLLMALCAATGAYCLLRARCEAAEERRTARAEALMGFGMAAMALPAAVVPPPAWAWVAYAVLFGAAALRALRTARRGGHHLHHLVGSLAMVYMALTMAPGIGGAGHGAGGAHAGHGSGAVAPTAGGIPLLTGLLLVYYAVYVLRSGARLIPAGAPGAEAGGGAGAGRGNGWGAWGARPELVPACRLTMGIGMLAMLLPL